MDTLLLRRRMMTQSQSPDYAGMYFTVEALTDGNVGMRDNSYGLLYYRINGGAWTQATGGSWSEGSNCLIAVSAGDKVEFKGTSNSYANRGIFGSGTTATVNIYGNIMSMFAGDDFANPDYAALGLNSLCVSSFCRGVKVVDASNLILAPLYVDIDGTMTSTGIGYDRFFRYCTALKYPPVLKDTTLRADCYTQMFQGCTSLESIKVSATEWNTAYADSWVEDVAPTGTFIKPAGLVIPTGTSGVPSGWTIKNV